MRTETLHKQRLHPRTQAHTIDATSQQKARLMSLGNSTSHYGLITRSFHWLIALLIISMIPLGIQANALAHQIEAGTSTDIDRARFLFSLHKTLGVTIFFAAIARILWAISQPKPAPLHPEKRAETFLAELVHWLLYASLVLVPLSGWIGHAATSGFAPIWWPFGQSLPLVPQSEAVAELSFNLHIIFERVLVIAIFLHVAGALKHHFWDKDGTLRRMTRGTPAEGPTGHAANRAAPLVAVGVYAVALGIGASLGLLTPPAAADSGDTLEATASEWTVTEGEITFTIQQFGSAVEGRFDEWTSAISFDPDAPVGDAPVGSVETTIAISSASIGSVTLQAMGPAFFDVEGHPTASYQGTIFNTADGYLADGTLTLKGITLPVSFPFDLTVADDTASITGTLPLNRLDYQIGTSEPTETNVGFEVMVQFAVTASRDE